ncbi:putative histidine kinase CKI1-like [Capsicum annuum]|nr:putative histidine kinase CKI1-like [Capsicum annuum]KAF3663196.1 putative histidine kinase CKI1-like [Capsicum annuum]
MEDHIFSHFNAILLLITITFTSIVIYKLTQRSHKLSHNFPPEISGGLPVIGHLLQFSGTDSIPLHRKLSSLADKYGPIFTFRLGIPRILVVSSYDAVKDCLNINDKVFAARPESLAGEYIGYNNAMLFLASYGDYWRKIRKVVIKEVLSSSRLEKLRDVRVSEVKTSIKELYILFPIIRENLDFPVTGDHSPVTGDDFPVGGDDVSLKVNGDDANFPFTRDQSPVSGENLDFPIYSDHFPVTGDDVSFPVTGDQSPVSEENLDFLITSDHFPVTRDDVSFPVDGDDVIKPKKQPQTEMQGKDSYNKVFLSGPSLDPTHSATGDNVIKSWKQPMVEMQSKVLYNSALSSDPSMDPTHSECFSASDCAVSGANLDFPMTRGDFRVKVNITNWIEKLTLSLIVKMIAGKSYGRVEKGGNEEEEEAERFKKALKDFMYISMEFVLWDAFPIPLFKWIDFQGHVKFMKRTFKDIDCVLQSWLDEHVKKRERVDFVDGNEEDFIDVMLSMMKIEDFIDGYSRETTIKATALSMVLDASDTTAIHLNWVMATLLNHRDALKKVQEELDTSVGRNRWVEESDIKDLVYFQAVVKETLRLYPPAPLLVPHESVEDCVVQGYHIPKGTRLWVNTMKLHRDPKIWSNPDTFDPERFLTSQAGVDVRGHQYEFIPFGSGRRSCPGITYATQVTHLAIAHLLQGFDFSTPSDEPLDMKEGLGMTMRKVNPIEVFITPRLPSVLYKF